MRGYRESLGYPAAHRALEALAGAVSGSLDGNAGTYAAAAPRDPPPRLALLASGGPAVEAGISAQVASLERSCRHLRFVGYREADAAAKALAMRLEQRLGDELERYELAAIPRGGWIAAGLVAGHLRRRGGLGTGAAPSGLLIVDDCALSGVAFRRFARRVGDRPLVFAPLFAPRALTLQIERQSPGVRAVVAGAGLKDTGTELPATEYAEWRRIWQQRLLEPPYWLGLPEFVCFPWNEPKRWVWNPVTESVEAAWRILPGELFPNAHRDPSLPPNAPAGEFQPGGEVVVAEVEGAVYVGDLGSGDSWLLEGSGAVFWTSLTRHGGRARAIANVVGRFDVDGRTAARDLDRWLRELTNRGLLVER